MSDDTSNGGSRSAPPPDDEGSVRLFRSGAVAHITFDRPGARNAMTFKMYDELDAIIAQLDSDPAIRAAVLRGAGGKAFVAGTDISEFSRFQGGEDGIAYEKRMDGHLDRLSRLRIPTLAVIEGFCIGGGLAIAACCDLRVAAPDARFGVPIARTIGNCLSMSTTSRLVHCFGESRTKRMLLLGDLLDADEALNGGFVSAVVTPDQLDQATETIAQRLSQNAPLTVRAGKEAIRRIQSEDAADGSDLIHSCYGSSDFRIGVSAFLAKTRPQWTGT